MTEEVFLRGDLARAARALTKVSARTIAEGAGLKKDDVKSFERGGHLNPEEVQALQASLEKYGASFISESGDEGYGVRRKYPRNKFMRLNRWEGEGGATFE